MFIFRGPVSNHSSSDSNQNLVSLLTFPNLISNNVVVIHSGDETRARCWNKVQIEPYTENSVCFTDIGGMSIIEMD